MSEVAARTRNATRNSPSPKGLAPLNTKRCYIINIANTALEALCLQRRETGISIHDKYAFDIAASRAMAQLNDDIERIPHIFDHIFPGHSHARLQYQ